MPEALQGTSGKLAALRKLAEHTTERPPKISIRDMVDRVFEQPCCRVGNLVDKGIVWRQASSRSLHGLGDPRALRGWPFGMEKPFSGGKLKPWPGQDQNPFRPEA